MPDPLVVKVMREHKVRLLEQEDATMREMARRWLSIERSLMDDLKTLALEAERYYKENGTINAALVTRMERAQKLLWQARSETGKYVQWADGYVGDYQAKLAEQGLADASAAITAVLKDNLIATSFDRLNVSAIESMIGLAGDGAPLERYLRAVQPDAVNGMLDALIDGVARGLHPTKIAEEMANGLGVGLQRALNTARTESLRAYRNAMLMQYDASGLVIGYKRISARDERVCAGCLFTDGELYEDLSQFAEHNQGRCTAVPVLSGVGEPKWQSPFDWFAGQSESVQESILGSGRFEAWKAGDVGLDAMVTRTEDATWGGAFVPTPVNQL